MMWGMANKDLPHLEDVDERELPTKPDNMIVHRDVSTPVVLPEEEVRWRMATEFQRELEQHYPLLLEQFHYLVVAVQEEKAAIRRDMLVKLNVIQDDVKRLQVQLAGVSAVAMGFSRDLKRTAYGWSQAYEDVKRLRLEMERLRNASG